MASKKEEVVKKNSYSATVGFEPQRSRPPSRLQEAAKNKGSITLKDIEEKLLRAEKNRKAIEAAKKERLASRAGRVSRAGSAMGNEGAGDTGIQPKDE